MIGNMKLLRIEDFDQLPLAMPCAQGDVHVKLLDVTYEPRPRLNMSPLHTVMLKCSVFLDTNGTHMLGRILSFVLRDIGPYVKVTRTINDPISAPVLVHGKKGQRPPRFLLHSHAETLREAAPKMGVNMVAELVSCERSSKAKRRRMVVPRTTSCRSTKTLQRLFVDLSATRP